MKLFQNPVISSGIFTTEESAIIHSYVYYWYTGKLTLELRSKTGTPMIREYHSLKPAMFKDLLRSKAKDAFMMRQLEGVTPRTDVTNKTFGGLV